MRNSNQKLNLEKRKKMEDIMAVRHFTTDNFTSINVLSKSLEGNNILHNPYQWICAIIMQHIKFKKYLPMLKT